MRWRRYLLGLLLVAGCATPAILEQPNIDNTSVDCHDGTRCPIAFPVCVNELSNGEHCEASDGPSPTWGARIHPRDAGADGPDAR